MAFPCPRIVHPLGLRRLSFYFTGVLSAEVALLANQAVVVVDAAVAADAAVLSAVEDAGFDASLLSAEDAPPPRAAAGAPPAKLTLVVEGMTCGACSSAVEKALRGVHGACPDSRSLRQSPPGAFRAPRASAAAARAASHTSR